MARNILYHSTNDQGADSRTERRSKPVTFKEALLRGQAPDKGLYVPDRIPLIPRREIVFMRKETYSEVAFRVTRKFLADEIPLTKLKRITDSAYDFDVPIEHVKDRRYVMRLDRGPTASFKDFAARMMARLMHHYLERESKRLLILTATSGDTGGAVANAFHGSDHVSVVILFPEKEISEMQRRQMTTLRGNVTALAMRSKFDDCQRLVKQAFTDPEFAGLNLSSANSINIGRILPQIVYYFYAYARLFERAGEEIVFSVPSGNFGDMFGAVLAKHMGLPVSKIIVATNRNDEFPRFLSSGTYEPIHRSINCISSAMNVGNPSNLTRLVHLYGGAMDEKGRLIAAPDMQKMRRDLWSESISEEETRVTIMNAFRMHSLLLEPHGAVAWAALNDLDPDGLCVSLETAHPAKFPEVIKETIGIEPDVPESMQGLEHGRESFLTIDNDYAALKDVLRGISSR